MGICSIGDLILDTFKIMKINQVIQSYSMGYDWMYHQDMRFYVGLRTGA